MEKEISEKAKKDGLNLKLNALKKVNYFTVKRGSEKQPEVTNHLEKNKLDLKNHFRKINTVQPCYHPDLDKPPMQVIEENSRIEFN